MRNAIAVLLTASLLALAACGDDDGNAESAAGGATGEQGPSGEPGTATYAGVRFSVEDTRSSAEPPEGNAEEGTTYLYLGVEAKSTLEDTMLSFPAGLFALRSGDGEVIRAESFVAGEVAGEVAVEAGETVSGELAFATAEELDTGDLTLEIKATDKEPAEIPLEGDPPELPYPTELAITGGRETVKGGSAPISGDLLEFEPLGVESSLDNGSERVESGSYYVFVDYRLTGLHNTAAGDSFDSTAIHLEVDGVPLNDTGSSIHFLKSKGEVQDDRAVFAVPQEASELNLIAGVETGRQATYPIELSGGEE